MNETRYNRLTTGNCFLILSVVRKNFLELARQVIKLAVLLTNDSLC